MRVTSLPSFFTLIRFASRSARSSILKSKVYAIEFDCSIAFIVRDVLKPRAGKCDPWWAFSRISLGNFTQNIAIILNLYKTY